MSNWRGVQIVRQLPVPFFSFCEKPGSQKWKFFTGRGLLEVLLCLCPKPYIEGKVKSTVGTGTRTGTQALFSLTLVALSLKICEPEFLLTGTWHVGVGIRWLPWTVLDSRSRGTSWVCSHDWQKDWRRDLVWGLDKVKLGKARLITLGSRLAESGRDGRKWKVVLVVVRGHW